MNIKNPISERREENKKGVLTSSNPSFSNLCVRSVINSLGKERSTSSGSFCNNIFAIIVGPNEVILFHKQEKIKKSNFFNKERINIKLIT